MYEDFYDDLSQEKKSNLDFLMEKFKSIIFDDIQAEVTIIKKENEHLIEQNQKLSEDNFVLKQQLEEKNKIIEDSKLITNLLNNKTI